MSKAVEQAEVALASAKAAYLSKLKRDCVRSEGSGAQERRREEHQPSLRDAIIQCERDLDKVKRHHLVSAGGKTIDLNSEKALGDYSGWTRDGG